jgi:hypothetical protein
MVALVVLALASAVPSHAVVVVATPSNELVDFFATPDAVTVAGGPLYLINADTVPHSVLSDAKRVDRSAAWCVHYEPGECPLFWSDEIVSGVVEVLGLAAVRSGTQYPFFCGVHHWMKGTLIVL